VIPAADSGVSRTCPLLPPPTRSSAATRPTPIRSLAASRSIRAHRSAPSRGGRLAARRLHQRRIDGLSSSQALSRPVRREMDMMLLSPPASRSCVATHAVAIPWALWVIRAASSINTSGALHDLLGTYRDVPYRLRQTPREVCASPHKHLDRADAPGLSDGKVVNRRRLPGVDARTTRQQSLRTLGAWAVRTPLPWPPWSSVPRRPTSSVDLPTYTSRGRSFLPNRSRPDQVPERGRRRIDSDQLTTMMALELVRGCFWGSGLCHALLRKQHLSSALSNPRSCAI